MKRRRIYGVVIFILFAVLFAFGYKYIKTVQKELTNRDQEILFDVCSVYEKYGAAEINDEFHYEHYEEDNTIIYKNGVLSFAEISGFKHIHCMIKGKDGTYFSAAISDEDKKYLLKLDESLKVTAQIEIDTLPAKLFIYEDSLCVYFIDQGKAVLYKVSFENKSFDLILDDISISDSITAKRIGSVYDDADEYLDMYDEYERYEKYGRDLLYIMFDKGCLEDVYVSNDRIAYKSTSTDDSGWNVVCDGKTSSFFNRDRCFGFTDSKNLLFYKGIPTGLFWIGLYYEYDTETGNRHHYRISLSGTVLSVALGEETALIKMPGNECGCNFYLMDTETGIYKIVGSYDVWLTNYLDREE